MALKVLKVDSDRYQAEVTPPHSTRPWKTPMPLRLRELIDTLVQKGCHQTDIGDALYFTEAPGIPAITRRGFTGHEHLDDWQLVHMNGRVYDFKRKRNVLTRLVRVIVVICSARTTPDVKAASFRKALIK